jgi:NADH-quinone oxidoreductase subunit A
MTDYLALGLLFTFGVILAGTTVALSVFFGPRNRSRWKQQSYESGSEPIGDARLRLDVKFYMIAISFIMFDLEAVFLIPWAVRAQSFGAWGFVAAMTFVAVLTAGLVYEWQKGGLEWE